MAANRTCEGTVLMADKKGAAPVATDPAGIRNVVVVGPTGSGKTTLIEHMLFAAGAISRVGRVEDGNTVCDFDPAASKQHRSVSLAVASIAWNGLLLNIIDTPGYADYAGELRAGLRGADAALFVVSAVDGIDETTRHLWDECEAVGMPRAIVVTKMDKERADFDETVAICHRMFTGGGGVLPMYLPIYNEKVGIDGFIDLLTTEIHEWTSGARRDRASEEQHQHLIEGHRNDLIEGIITESEDEGLMDRYMAGEDIGLDGLVNDLERAVARGHFHPVLGHGADGKGVGTELILDLIARCFPSPVEHALPVVTGIHGEPKEPLQADPNGPLVAEVIKTTTDPYIGKISIVRVFSGTLAADQTVHVSGHFSGNTGHEDHDVDERIGQISSPLGAEQRPLGNAIAGMIVSVGKLTRAETGDTLSATATPLRMEPWPMPDPMLPVAIAAHSSADEDKLGQALGRLLAEDPTLRLEQNEENGQMVLWTMGEAHSDLIVDRLKTRYSVAVDAIELRLSLRESFTGPANGLGRLVKQSGGHGQYAVCEITVEPTAPGSGFEFVDKVVGGAVPRNFIPSVEKGVRAQMTKGVAAGYPLVDIRVTLFDGKAHSVDSSDMAFQTAGSLALKDAASKTNIALLEPMLEIGVLVPDEHVGAVMSDLATRRGQVTGTEAVAGGRTLVSAHVPEIEVTRYAIDIRSITHGTGQYTRTPIGYAAMPPMLAKKVIEEAQAKQQH